MEFKTTNYIELLEKLDKFIRKFYINKIIKGTLFSIAILVALFLLFNLLESKFYFSTSVRKTFFVSFLLVSILSLGYFIFIPLFQYFKLGKTISHEYAAKVIGKHFTNIQDKLLNVLQLKKQVDESEHKQLLTASIEQKTNEINLVPFKSAIDLAKNKKYIKYAAPPLFILLGILFSFPDLLRDSTTRIIQNNIEFEKPAPFYFRLQEDNLEVIQYDDFALNVKIEGESLPNEVFIEADGFQYRMNKIESDHFTYVFRNVRKPVKFKIQSGEINTTEKILKVLLKPVVNSFDLSLKYPPYIGRKNEIVANIGDVKVPQGTRISWNFDTQHTDDVFIKFGDKQKISLKKIGESKFSYSKRIIQESKYSLYVSNNMINEPDSMNFLIAVTPDEHPIISVKKFQDSTQLDMIYFAGKASDDYGISRLTFNYILTSPTGSSRVKSIPVLNKYDRDVAYNYTLDIASLDMKPGEKLDFYFEVFDNDAVNGAKSTKTKTMEFDKPSLDEIEKQEEESEKEIKEDLKKAIKEMKKLREEFKKLREKLLEKKELNWQEKKDLEKLLEKQKEIQKKLDEAKKKFEEKKKNEEKLKEQTPEEQAKQEKMEEMFKEAENQEMQELMQKIEALMEELKKDEAQDMLEQMEQSEELQEMKMDRLLEMFKQLEVEKDIKEQIEKLKELGEKQEKLAEETKKKEKSQDQLKKEQEQIDKEFEELKENQKEIEKKNEELEQPKDLGEDTEEEMEDIQEDLDDSQDKLDKGENSGASKSQKSAGGKMKKMAGGMEEAMESAESDQAEEDIKVIRQILENLVTISFDQEDLEHYVAETKTTTPRYIGLVQEEFKLKDDFKIVEDSLIALSKRVEEVESFVIEKVLEIKQDFKKSVDLLEGRKKTDATVAQRKIMKNLNDLALMLDESLQNMQAKAGAKPGSGSCNKPGGKGKKPGKGQKGSSGPPMDKITEGQKGMGKKLGKMGEGMKKGDKPGAKDFAQAAAQQAALRKLLQDIQNSKMEQGQGDKKLQDIIDQMDKIETDLVNKKLDAQMMTRQQEIVTRLLEATKAERQREYDNKRKSETAIEQKREMPAALKEYLKKRMSEIEMYKSVSPSLRPYYRKMVDEYYKELKHK